MSLNEISEDHTEWVKCSNQPLFRTDVDYDDMVKKRNIIVDKWKSLTPDERKKYKDQKQFEEKNDCPDISDPDLRPARNLSLLKKEVYSRLATASEIGTLPIDYLGFRESMIEMTEGLENREELRSLYRIRKQATGDSKNAGINGDEALRIKNCFAQGRELFFAGESGSLMVKPLNFFYAMTAYAYGIIILNNPLRYRKDMLPGSHGMSYLPKEIRAQFGGDSANGTFSDLVTAFPTHLIKIKDIEFNIDCTESILEFYERRFTVGLGTLLSMVPEMAGNYRLATGRASRCFPLEVTVANDPRKLMWEFAIGDGETGPSRESVEKAFPGCATVGRHGKTVVSVVAANAHQIKACIYTDLRGNLWFIDNPFFPLVLPEVAIHFLTLSVFSNIMRYRPDEWGNVLTNDVSSDVFLLTKHYLSNLERKFLLLVLRSASRYIPYISSS